MESTYFETLLKDIIRSIAIFFIVHVIFDFFEDGPIEWKALAIRCSYIGIVFTFVLRVMKSMGKNSNSSPA